MSQVEILGLLKKNPNKWYCVDEIYRTLNLSHTAVKRNVQGLAKYRIVQKRTNGQRYEYGLFV
jgi:predicted transcriptional regulator